jgi:hypothetical protein
MNDGVTYNEATPEEKEPAKTLADKVLGRSSGTGYAAPDSTVALNFRAAMLQTGMEAEELAFELVNWPRSKTQAINNKLIPTDDFTNMSTATSASSKIKAAANMISQRNAWYRKIRDFAILNSISRLQEIDNKVKEHLEDLGDKIQVASVEDINITDKLNKKIEIIQNSIKVINAINTNIDFNGFLENARNEAYNKIETLSKGLPAGLTGYKPPFRKVAETGEEIAIVNSAKADKDRFITGIVKHVNTLLREIGLFLENVKVDKEKLKELYHNIGVLIFNTARVSDIDPVNAFRDYRLTEGIEKNYADDSKFQWELYWSLPSEITDRAEGELKDSYKIPQPVSGNVEDMKRSKLGIKRTCADPDSIRAVGASRDWGLNKTDDEIW